MKALVTGGAGFIGSNLTRRLCEEGHEVIVLDDFSSSGRKNFPEPRARIVNGSVGDVRLLEDVLSGVDVVFHLAATGIISRSLENPPAYFENNLMNGITLLDVMRKKGVKKIIYSSSSGVYGEPERIPIKEDDRKEPVNPYGASKFAFEHALSSYCHAFGIESVSLRYFNVYGPGDRQQPVTRAVPSWIQTALRNEPVPVYWGLKQKKDYIFVDDVVRANMLAAEKVQGAAVYNVGSGKGLYMYEIFSTLEEVLGRKLPIKQKGERAGDPSVLVADISRIKKELGWKPTIDIKTGILRTVAYYKASLSE